MMGPIRTDGYNNAPLCESETRNGGFYREVTSSVYELTRRSTWHLPSTRHRVGVTI